MKHIHEYRDVDLVKKLIGKINEIAVKPVSLMEVCGGHTWAIQKFGIPSMIPESIKLLSGPGCPVCVTDKKYIDRTIAFSRLDDVIITTFGDLIKVPGSTSSLSLEKSRGADVRIVYSITDAIKIARDNPTKRVVFLGIGFETTAAATAAGMYNAVNEGLKNFFLYSSQKIMPPAMAAIIEEGIKINGYIAPGHVSAVTGTGIYEGIPAKYKVGCVIAGFEAVDILQSIYMLLNQIVNENYNVEIQYKRVVTKQGNTKAQNIISQIFETRDDWWRGLGVLPQSGLGLKQEFAEFDAERMIDVEVEETIEEKGCICGDILKGLKTPADCKLFAKVCNNTNPVGACMVSHEGACNAYYRFNRK